MEIKEEMKEEAEEDKKLSPVTSENNEVTGDFHYITSLIHQAKKVTIRKNKENQMYNKPNR